MRQVFTVNELINLISSEFDNKNAINDYINNEWRSYSTKQYLTEVKYVSLALHKAGVKKGDKVGLMASSSARWSIVDFAIMGIGGVCVPLFANISVENFHYIAALTKLDKIFAGGKEGLRRCQESRDMFKSILSLEEGSLADGVISYDEILAIGQKVDEEQPHLYDELLARSKPEDLATIIFTSGSTGVPKGAEHTHSSLVSLVNTDIFKWDKDRDCYLNVLPLAHVYARIFNIIMLAWGISTYYFNDLKNLGAACQQIHPTIMVVVPRLLERVYTKMVARLHEASFLKRAIGQWAFDLANREEPTLWKQLFHPLAEKLVYSHLRDALGGRLRVVLSGGAALDPHLNHFFIDIGLPLFEGWGLTEVCPVCVNRHGENKIGTVGKPINAIKVKTSPSGELLVRGANVMRGYFENPEATREAFDQDGWLRTGDQGSVDAEGYVKIEGRILELFKTSTGEMVAPIPIEQALCKVPFIQAAMVVADKRKFVSCLVVPDFDILRALKVQHGAADLTDDEFLNSDYIKQEMQKLLKRVNEHANYWEQIRDYRFIPHDLSVEQGELTPSMKIVRKFIEKRYKGLIDSMYEQEESV